LSRPVSTESATDELRAAGRGLLPGGGSDVGRSREHRLRRRQLAALGVLGPVAIWTAARLSLGLGVLPVAVPRIDWLIAVPILFFALLAALLLGTHLATGRSPHVTLRPEQIDVRLDDVVGIDTVKEEAVRSLSLFLAHRTFADEMGGRPRRGLLLEGAPGTGKTHTAKAIAAEAGVPFLFATATSFQSSFQGATQRKIRAYFKALRAAAIREGGAIGFIDEFDAIAQTRQGVAAATPTSFAQIECGGLDGLPSVGAPAGVQVDPFLGGGDVQMAVNELLVQLQSIDEPTGWQRLLGRLTDAVNAFLPASRALRGPGVHRANVLLLASTNRADALDPALLRPGRFDKRLSFDLPAKAARRQLVDHFLGRKAHAPELDADDRRDALAAVTQGYSPAKLEGLMDEALVAAVADGRTAMTWADVEHARMVIEVGMGQPVEYTDHERRLIATHEAGHATVAWLEAPHRRLEILTIVKRRGALGLLAHGDREDVYTRSRAEMSALIRIAMGGQVAEELFFGDVSTGPSGDLLYATNVAAEMVGVSGMSDSLVSFAAVQGGSFDGTNLVGRVLADSASRQQVEDMLRREKEAVRDLLAGKAALVVALRDALLERHELIGAEITDVLEEAAARIA
jgi:cell division protease FtsH